MFIVIGILKILAAIQTPTSDQSLGGARAGYTSRKRRIGAGDSFSLFFRAIFSALSFPSANPQSKAFNRRARRECRRGRREKPSPTASFEKERRLQNFCLLASPRLSLAYNEKPAAGRAESLRRTEDCSPRRTLRFTKENAIGADFKRCCSQITKNSRGWPDRPH